MSEIERTRRPIVRVGLTVAAVALAAAAGVALSPDDDRVVQAAGEPCVDTGCGAGGEFHTIEPIRLLDTREASDPLAGRKTTQPKDNDSGLFELTISGSGGLPAFVDADNDGIDDNVLAVAVNITVVNPTRQGHLRVFGSGAVENETALINYKPGSIVPNSAILRPGDDGKLTFRLVTPSGAGQADVVVDMFGWFSTSSYSTSGARLYPAGPARLFDSREIDDPLGAFEQVRIPIRGADAIDPPTNNIVPNSNNVVGALVNISAVNREPQSTNTFMSALPNPVPSGQVPETANINVPAGVARSALAIVPVGSDGSIHVFNRAGSSHLTVDLMGYLIKNQDPSTRLGRVVPLVSAFRVLDTRESQHLSQPLPPGNAELWNFEDFVDDVRIGNDWVGNQLGLLGNLTGAELIPQRPGTPTSSYLVGYPSSASGEKPLVANLTMTSGDVVPNMAMLRYGETDDGPDRLTFYNRGGFMHYVLDVSAVILDD